MKRKKNATAQAKTKRALFLPLQPNTKISLAEL
jgi:hypothetical protein